MEFWGRLAQFGRERTGGLIPPLQGSRPTALGTRRLHFGVMGTSTCRLGSRHARP